MLHNQADANVGIYSILFIVSAFLLFFLFEKLQKMPRSLVEPSDGNTDSVVFLFREKQLIDATSSGRALLASASEKQNEWQNLVAILSPSFPDFASKAQALSKTGSFILRQKSCNDGAFLTGEFFNGIMRFVYASLPNETEQAYLPPCNIAALEDEIEALRHLTNSQETPSWVEDCDGGVIWANSAYFTLIDTTQAEGSSSNWPLLNLFPSISTEGIDRQRCELQNTFSGETAWFKVFRKSHAGRMYCHAIPIDEIISAETALADFQQTLTKTFATLSVGLAIFDKKRRLVVFNPSLVDLTSIGFEALSSQPSMYDFFNLLRETRIVPDKKDFSDWRHHVSLLESVVSNGVYEETWSLPTGQVFRFTGHPQPDGAIALFLEDISAEISLTRNFRAELDLGQAILDQIDDAVVVFSASNIVTVSNAAYAKLWGVDPGSSLCSLSFYDSLNVWEEFEIPKHALGQIKTAHSHHSPLSIECGYCDNQTESTLKIKGSPLAGGSYMVRFSQSKVTNLEHIEIAAEFPLAARET